MILNSFTRQPAYRRRTHRSAGVAAVQQLEQRTLLSGNVLAFFSGGKLTLVGDDAGNEVEVKADELGNFQVNGLNGTTINGAAQFARTNTNLSSIIAGLNGGDDVLDIGRSGLVSPTLSGKAWIDLGSGADRLTVSNVGFADGLTAYGRQGADIVQLTNVGVGRVFVDGGVDSDVVALNQVSATQDIVLWGQQGDDQIAVLNSNTTASLRINAGDNDDVVLVADAVVGLDLVTLGAFGHDETVVTRTAVGRNVLMLDSLGNDYLEFSQSNGYHVSINGGFDKDEIYVDRADVRWNLALLGDFGDDVTNVVGTNVAGMLFWNGGWGNDGFGMATTIVGGILHLNGDYGDDLIGIASSTIRGEAFIYGFPGQDALVLSDAPGGANTFEWNVFVNMGLDDDVVEICGAHNFLHDVLFFGGYGFDRINIETPQNVGGTLKVDWFESVDDATVSDRRNEMVAALTVCFPDIGRTPLGQLCQGGIVGDNPQVILVVDISGSTLDPFQGTPVGDVNGDGFADTVLDAELAGMIAFHNAFAAANLGPESTISVVLFDSGAVALDLDPVAPGVQTAIAPGADANNNGIADFVEAVTSIFAGGGTNFEAGLQEAITVFGSILTPNGDPNVIFLSDGFPNDTTSYPDEVATLTGLGANLVAFGVGQGASLPALQLIDPMASIIDSTDDFLAALSGFFGTPPAP